MRKKYHRHSKVSNIYLLAILILLAFVGYSSASSFYKETLLFFMIFLIILFFIFITSGIIRRRRRHPHHDSYWKLTRRIKQSFLLLLALILIGGGIYLFWPSVLETISNRATVSQNTNVAGNQPENIKINPGSLDISTTITWIVTLAILAIIGYIVWENRLKLLGYIRRLFWTTWPYYYVHEFSWEPKAKKNRQFSDVWNAIKEFRPERYCSSERDYQKELYHWLKYRFPDIRWEPATGGIRTDLAIGKIAIELKADANDGTLDSLSFKVITHPSYYERLYIVIFGHHFRKRRFKEFKNGTRNRYPEVGLISKPKYVLHKSTY